MEKSLEEKVNDHLKTLYPECDLKNLTPEQIKEKEFIQEHLDKIESAIDSVVGDALEFGSLQFLNDEAILNRAMDHVRKQVSTDEIGKAVLGRVSPEKQKAAEAVEAAEEKQSQNREGEELGDGN